MAERSFLRNRLRRVWRSPVLHFLALGLAVFLPLRSYLAEPDVLLVNPSLVAQTVQDWETLQSQPISAEQRQRIGEQLKRSELLIQVAREAGLERSAAVELRLLQLSRFLGLVDSDASDRAAIEAGRELGLHHSDTVVRRYLERAGESVLARGVDPSISEQAIRTFYEQHSDDYRLPRRIALSHVYIGDGGAAGVARAESLAAQLRERDTEPMAAIALGDAFYGGHELVLQTHRQLADRMGRVFADAVWELPPGQWSAPLHSAFGLHLVMITGERPESVKPLEAVREDVVGRLLRQREQELVDQRLRELRQRYRIVGLEALGNQG